MDEPHVVSAFPSQWLLTASLKRSSKCETTRWHGLESGISQTQKHFMLYYCSSFSAAWRYDISCIHYMSSHAASSLKTVNCMWIHVNTYLSVLAHFNILKPIWCSNQNTVLQHSGAKMINKASLIEKSTTHHESRDKFREVHHPAHRQALFHEVVGSPSMVPGWLQSDQPNKLPKEPNYHLLGWVGVEAKSKWQLPPASWAKMAQQAGVTTNHPNFKQLVTQSKSCFLRLTRQVQRSPPPSPQTSAFSRGGWKSKYGTRLAPVRPTKQTSKGAQLPPHCKRAPLHFAQVIGPSALKE